MKPKIWYLLPSLQLGGSEKHVVELASGMKERGFETGIVCLFQEGVLAEEARRQDIPVLCLNAGRKWGPRALIRIFQWMRENRPDILHTYFFGFHFFAGLPARLLNIPVVLSSRRDIDLYQKRRHLWMENLGNLFVDRVLCCSQAVQKWVLGREMISPEKVLTLYNGVDLTRFPNGRDSAHIRRQLRIPEKATVVGTVANFSSKKGYADLLEAARKVQEDYPETWFLWVGSGPLELEMRTEAHQFPRGEQIVFTGARTDIPDLLAAMDIFVLASYWEGLPNVLLEAMACGKPVVSTNVGGIPELIEPPETGYLVLPHDPQNLASALRTLLRNPAQARLMGRAGRRKIEEKFSLRRMLDEYQAFYLSLLRSDLAKKAVVRIGKEGIAASKG